jgi:hypothetical protein
VGKSSTNTHAAVLGAWVVCIEKQTRKQMRLYCVGIFTAVIAFEALRKPDEHIYDFHFVPGLNTAANHSRENTDAKPMRRYCVGIFRGCVCGLGTSET